MIPEAALNLVGDIFSHNVLYVFSELPYSCFKFQEVRRCTIRLFTLTTSTYLVVIACVQFVTCRNFSG